MFSMSCAKGRGGGGVLAGWRRDGKLDGVLGRGRVECPHNMQWCCGGVHTRDERALAAATGVQGVQGRGGGQTSVPFTQGCRCCCCRATVPYTLYVLRTAILRLSLPAVHHTPQRWGCCKRLLPGPQAAASNSNAARSRPLLLQCEGLRHVHGGVVVPMWGPSLVAVAAPAAMLPG